MTDKNIANGLYTEFNLNDYVWVKLTAAGRKEHRKQHDEFCAEFKGMDVDYKTPDEIDGWSHWQLWVLMQTFGNVTHIGFNPPFETTIRIEHE